MVLSHDHWCWHGWDFDKRYKDFPWKRHPFTCIPFVVLPALRERGASEFQIAQMLARNPQRSFEKQGAY
jgi:predicted metal-dependent phosphotriesterase family hydrolase